MIKYIHQNYDFFMTTLVVFKVMLVERYKMFPFASQRALFLFLEEIFSSDVSFDSPKFLF